MVFYAQVFSDLSEELLSLDEVTTLLFYRKRFLRWRFWDNLKSDFFFTLIYTYTIQEYIFLVKVLLGHLIIAFPNSAASISPELLSYIPLQVLSYSFTYIYIYVIIIYNHFLIYFILPDTLFCSFNQLAIGLRDLSMLLYIYMYIYNVHIYI